MATKYSVLIAGSSQNSLSAAKALLENGHFTISAVLTPAPKPIGRHLTLTPNPLHQFALDNHLPVHLVTHQLKDLQDSLLESSRPDFLLVVDFGYFIPSWLLDFPLIAPLNLHPSALPKYRGASPGQFVILHDEPDSALTLMKLNSALDQGDIIHQQFFPVDKSWTAADYYHFAFNHDHLALAAEAIVDFAQGKIIPQPQPLASPTPVTRELTKNDGFVPLEAILAALTPYQPWQSIFPSYEELSPSTSFYSRGASPDFRRAPDLLSSGVGVSHLTATSSRTRDKNDVLGEKEINTEFLNFRLEPENGRVASEEKLLNKYNTAGETAPEEGLLGYPSGGCCDFSPERSAQEKNQPNALRSKKVSPTEGVASIPSETKSSLNKNNRVILSPQQLDRAIHAFFPFPTVWTLMPTPQGTKRVKLLASRLTPDNKLFLTRVQLEGKPAKDLAH